MEKNQANTGKISADELYSLIQDMEWVNCSILERAIWIIVMWDKGRFVITPKINDHEIVKAYLIEHSGKELVEVNIGKLFCRIYILIRDNIESGSIVKSWKEQLGLLS